MHFSGTGVTVSAAGFGSLTGDFSVARGSDNTLLIGAQNVNATFGSLGAGVSVTDATVGLYVAPLNTLRAGYALSASGTAVLSGFSGVSLNATAQVRVNTLGQAVNQSVVVGGQTVTVAFGARRRCKKCW